MENQSKPPTAGESEILPALDEMIRKIGSKQPNKNKLSTGLGISSPAETSYQGLQELYEVDSPADERYWQRNDLFLDTQGSGNAVRLAEPKRPNAEDQTERKRTKQKTRKDPKIHNELKAKRETSQILETTDTDNWDRALDDGDLRQLFDGNIFAQHTAKQQKNTRIKVATKQRPAKHPKGLKPRRATKPGVKNEPADIALVDRFYEAAATGDVEEVTKLIAAEGIKIVSATNAEKTTALHLAARNGEQAVIQLLLQHHADIDAEDIVGRTSLYWAVRENKIDTVEYLLKKGANRDIKADNGWTPLHVVAYTGREEILALLLSFGFEVEARNNKEETPLFLAELKEHRGCAWSLIKAGANPKLKSDSGNSPIGVAISKYNEPMLKDILIRLVPDLENKTYDQVMYCLGTQSRDYQTSVLWSEVEKGNVALVRLFLMLGVYPETLHEGYTILQTSIIHDQKHTARCILEAGANTETVASDGSTALLIAAKFNRPQMVNILLDNNANVEAKMMHTGRTALHVAVSLANVKLNKLSTKEAAEYTDEAKELVRLLLKRGAYFGAKDKINKTPLQLAEEVKDKLRAPTDILLNPPAVEGQSGYEEPMPPASKIPGEEAEICKAFKAFIVDFHKNTKEVIESTVRSSPDRRNKKAGRNQERSPSSRSTSDMQSSMDQKAALDRVDWLPRIKSVHEVTHSSGPEEIMEEAYRSTKTSRDLLFRWIHVPANNIAWIKDLVHKICHEREHKKGAFEEMANFVTKTGSEHWGAMHHSRYMKTCFTVQDHNPFGKKTRENDAQKKKEQESAAKEKMDTKLAIYMPFLTFDTIASQTQISKIVKDFETRRKASSTCDLNTQSTSDKQDCKTHLATQGNNVSKDQLSTPDLHRTRHRQFSDPDHFNLAQDGGGKAYLINDKNAPPKATLLVKPITTKEKYKMLIREYLGHRHGPIHISRTLDQFYYNSIETGTRDLDQVVYRYAQKFRTRMVVESEILEAYKKGIEIESACVVSKPKDRALTTHSRMNSPVVGNGRSTFKEAKEDVEETKEGDKEVPVDTESPRIFMVDQMWIWIVDEKTIISSFPQRWEEENSQEPKVLETIQTHLAEKNRPQVKSVYEMAAMITSFCMRFADKCTVKGDISSQYSEESFMQIYAMAVSTEAAKEAELFNGFEVQILAAKAAAEKVLADAKAAEEGKTKSKETKKKNSPPLNKKEDGANPSKTHFKPVSYIERNDPPPLNNKTQVDSKASSDTASEDSSSSLLKNADKTIPSKSDISGEIAVLKEIKDIRDELNILRRILEEQKSIADELFQPGNGLHMNPGVQKYYKEKSGLARRIQDVEKMDQDAGRTYKHVNNLLDLKQKQANIDEALAGAEQGKIAADQTRIAADQGAVVLIFTLVTIIFLPMSFLTSLYALNISAFPHDAQGVLAYPTQYLFSRLFGISTAIACILLTLAFQVRRIRRIFKEKKREWFPKDDDGKHHFDYNRFKVTVLGLTRYSSKKAKEDSEKKEEEEERDRHGSRNGSENSSLRTRSPKEGARVDEILVGLDEDLEGVRSENENGNGKGGETVERRESLPGVGGLIGLLRKVSERKKVYDVEATVER